VNAGNPSDLIRTTTFSPLDSNRTYNLVVYQIDDYSALNSERCPTEAPLILTTLNKQTITIKNYHCTPISSLKMKGEDVELLNTANNEVIAVGGTKYIDLCGPLRSDQIKDDTIQDGQDKDEVRKFDGTTVNLFTIFSKLYLNYP
jgi:hypothetical protein